MDGTDTATGACGDAWLTASTLGVGLAAAAMSFATLMHLAELCGYAPRLAWLHPFALDLYGATATRIWLGSRRLGSVRRWARTSAWLAIGASVVANALEHALVAVGSTPVPWGVVVAVTALPPVALGLAVHLLTLLRSAPRATVAEVDGVSNGGTQRGLAEQTEPAAGRLVVLEREAKGQHTRRRGRSSAAASKRSELRRLFDGLGPDDRRSGYELAKELGPAVGIHEGTARRHLSAWVAERRSASGSVEAGDESAGAVAT